MDPEDAIPCKVTPVILQRVVSPEWGAHGSRARWTAPRVQGAGCRQRWLLAQDGGDQRARERQGVRAAGGFITFLGGGR